LGGVGCGVGGLGFGGGAQNPQPQIPNPQSPIPNLNYISSISNYNTKLINNLLNLKKVYTIIIKIFDTFKLS